MGLAHVLIHRVVVADEKLRGLEFLLLTFSPPRLCLQVFTFLLNVSRQIAHHWKRTLRTSSPTTSTAVDNHHSGQDVIQQGRDELAYFSILVVQQVHEELSGGLVCRAGQPGQALGDVILLDSLGVLEHSPQSPDDFLVPLLSKVTQRLSSKVPDGPLVTLEKLLTAAFRTRQSLLSSSCSRLLSITPFVLGENIASSWSLILHNESRTAVWMRWFPKGSFDVSRSIATTLEITNLSSLDCTAHASDATKQESSSDQDSRQTADGAFADSWSFIIELLADGSDSLGVPAGHLLGELLHRDALDVDVLVVDPLDEPVHRHRRPRDRHLGQHLHRRLADDGVNVIQSLQRLLNQLLVPSVGELREHFTCYSRQSLSLPRLVSSRVSPAALTRSSESSMQEATAMIASSSPGCAIFSTIFTAASRISLLLSCIAVQAAFTALFAA
eukprot:756649-Hanusia_phi.AAC.2